MKTRKSAFALFAASYLAIYKMLPVCLGGSCGRSPTHWRYLATPSKPRVRGKLDGSVESGLTGLAATALAVTYMIQILELHIGRWLAIYNVQCS